MRFFMIIALMLIMPCIATAQNSKKALMLAVFGTSTEAIITFDELVPLVEKEFPDRDVFVPFTSGVIRNKLNANRIPDSPKILSPEEMLQKLKNEGYTDIAIVTTILFDGVEHEKLQATADSFAKANSGIKITYLPPILSDKSNHQPVVDTLAKYILGYATNIVVSHGSHDGHPVELTYYQIADLISKTYPNTTMASVEGIPDMGLALDYAYKNKRRDVRFIVFMFVAGDHAENDIVSDEEGSLFSQAKAIGKSATVAYTELNGAERIMSLGLDPSYRALLVDYYVKNVAQ